MPRYAVELDAGARAVAAVGRAGTRDLDRDGAGQLYKRVSTPEPSRVMRHRDHRHAGMGRKPCTANAVLAFLSGRNARALRKNHNPESPLKPVFPLLDDLFKCRLS